jgi:hypothetical protein
MKRNRCTIVLLLALLAGAWICLPAVGADGETLTAEEKAEQSGKRQEDLHDKQMKGLAACVVGVIFVSLLFWSLNIYNKNRKRKALLERQEAAPVDEMPMPYTPIVQETLPSEPPAADWSEPPAGDW